jgi:hypothetical protein
MIKKTGILFLTIFFCSCSYFKADEKPEAIARVKDVYLYKEEIKELIPSGTSKKDSAEIIKNYINRWAEQKLLIDAAEINLSEEKKADFDELIKQYKVDLYTKAYIEEIVKNTVDTIVSQSEIIGYYNQNKENFRTNGTLVRLRYINIKKDNPRFGTIRSKFFNFKKSDKKFWDVYVLQCNNFALNDTVWTNMEQVYSKLPFINPDNKNTYISAGKAFEYGDASNDYLVKITNVINNNQISPFEYIKPTLKEIILNKRKLELIKKFEKEITDDAIKNNKYEIYKH